MKYFREKFQYIAAARIATARQALRSTNKVVIYFQIFDTDSQKHFEFLYNREQFGFLCDLQPEQTTKQKDFITGIKVWEKLGRFDPV